MTVCSVVISSATTIVSAVNQHQYYSRIQICKELQLKYVYSVVVHLSTLI